MIDEFRKLTVVVPVHERIRAEELRAALDSLVAQTRVPEAVVVVLDGPVSDGVVETIEGFADDLNMSVLELSCQSGAGPARQAGLLAASTHWVGFADADDVSTPERFAKQLALAEAEDLDLVSGTMEEIDPVTGQSLGLRRFPRDHAAIVRALRWRNVLNQPAALVRREVALRAGGYRDVPLMEDYDLWVRMFAAGARAANHPDILVQFRGGMPSQMRRRTRAARGSEWQLQRTMLDAGLTTPWVAVAALCARTTYRLVPLRWVPWVYRRLFLESNPRVRTDRPTYDTFRDMSMVRGPMAELLARQVVETTKTFLRRPLMELNVLDVGSGYGHTALELSRVCGTVCGLEPAFSLHAAALELVSQADRPGSLEFVHGEIETFSPDRSFDLVVLDNVYEHLRDQAAAMKTISGLLAPGGVLFLVCPNKLWPLEAHYRLLGLAWLPVRIADAYLRISGRGTSYEDASYAPTFWSLRRQLRRDPSLSFKFVLPGDPEATITGNAWHYRLGMKLLGRAPCLWAISKAFVVVAVKSQGMEPQSRG